MMGREGKSGAKGAPVQEGHEADLKRWGGVPLLTRRQRTHGRRAASRRRSGEFGAYASRFICYTESMTKKPRPLGVSRSSLRIVDLKQRRPVLTRLLNVKIPTHVQEGIARLARQLGTSKREVVIALLNSGLERWRQHAASARARR